MNICRDKSNHFSFLNSIIYFLFLGLFDCFSHHKKWIRFRFGSNLNVKWATNEEKYKYFSISGPTWFTLFSTFEFKICLICREKKKKRERAREKWETRKFVICFQLSCRHFQLSLNPWVRSPSLVNMRHGNSVVSFVIYSTI
jgi:hypothetical protein